MIEIDVGARSLNSRRREVAKEAAKDSWKFSLAGLIDTP
jgi:hypothetical protein